MIRRFGRFVGNPESDSPALRPVDRARPGGLTMGAMSASAANFPAAEKSQFRIGEVCRLTSLKAFVLRYWETEFPMLQPLKSPTGHRLYRREDIETVLEIKRLLYQEGFTIAGARRFLEQRGEDGGREAPAEASAPAAPSRAGPRRLLLDLHEELRAILTLLEDE
jgi:DNA-binding transcriptional MerR regulator